MEDNIKSHTAPFYNITLLTRFMITYKQLD